MDYPVRLELDAPERVANWRPLVQWLLAFPHSVIAGALGYAAFAVAVVSWFTIVFTGRLSEGMANFQCMVIRYQTRTNSYALWLREPYPPFDFSMTAADPGLDPLRVDFRPQLEDRNRLTVALRIFWIIPIALFLAVVAFATVFVLIAAFFAVLFTRRWPEGMRRFVLGNMRLWAQVTAYGCLLVDDYPPFSVSEPAPSPPSTQPLT
ncbi:MAG TPA: DUF4389 domain-containing protein [Acidimicrobiales bacterium]|nr:DUF4389 domain-containing protein [Acidimicrobiales bacterium]